MFRLRLIGKIIKRAGLGHITAVFCGLFCLSALVIWLGDAGVENFGDGLWLCFQTVTTIGFGDMPTQGALCRTVLVLLSLVSVFYLAVVTGVVVAYCNQLIAGHARDCIAVVADDLERLDEMTPEQLRELAERVRAVR